MVATLVVTGLVNSWFLVGYENVPTLLATPYSQLLVTKILLFCAMLALAALNRFRLTPRFEQAMASDDPVSAMGALRLSLSFETACVVAILVLVAWLRTLVPPVSAA